MLEREFQAMLIRELKNRFVGCIVLKNDANYVQGFPDLLILFGSQWAALEVKKSLNSPRRPNQAYYVDLTNQMSFGAFICPENMEEVLDGLQRSFEAGWAT